MLFAAYSHPPLRFWAMDTYEEIKLKMLGAAHHVCDVTLVCVSGLCRVCVVCVLCVCVPVHVRVRVLVCTVRVRVECSRRLSQISQNTAI